MLKTKNVKSILYTILFTTLAIQLHSSDDEFEIVTFTVRDKLDHIIQEEEVANNLLIESAKNSNYIGMKQALNQRANINFQGIDGNTAAHYIASNDFVHEVSALMTQHNASIIIPNNIGQTEDDILNARSLELANARAAEKLNE